MAVERLKILVPKNIPALPDVEEWLKQSGVRSLTAKHLAKRQSSTNLEAAENLEQVLAEFPEAGNLIGKPLGQPDDLAHDRYFRIDRVEGDEPAGFVRAALAVRAIFLRDVDESPTTISTSVLDRIDEAFCALSSCLLGGKAGGATGLVSEWKSRGSEQIAQTRWVRGHQVFAVLTQGLIFAFQCMGHALRVGQSSEVRRWGDLAVSLLRGSGASLEFTGDFPAGDYEKVVRPSMSQPECEFNLSGLMSVDHRFLVQMMRDMRPMLRALGEREQPIHDGLASELAKVYDSHIHVCERFVGKKPSLLTEGKGVKSGPSLVEQFKTLRMKPFEQVARTAQLRTEAAACPFHK